VWLAPEQVVIIPVADRHLEYARKVEADLRRAGIRVRLDARSERMNLKIRQAQLDKVPGMAIIGDREVEAGRVSVRLRDGSQANDLPVDTLKEAAAKAISERSRELLLLDS
jgi:threonyl-tRNA synthetase